MSRGAPLEVVRGEIAEARLLKEGWGRLRLRAGSGDSASVTVTGQILGFETGTTVECRGRWDIHPTYGKQFRATTIVTVIPSDASGAIAWIASRLPAIGRKRATELVNRYGIPELWNVLEHAPERLAADVRGITPELARAIADEYSRVRDEREEMVTLRGWGLSEPQIKRCRQVWKTTTKVIEELRKNPYQLCELVYGFGFDRADQVARRMGIPVDHPGRIQACLLHQLGEAEGAGHCYVPTGKLVALAADALGLEQPKVRAELEAVCDGERAVRADEGVRVYRATTHAAELAVVAGVQALLEVAAADAANELNRAVRHVAGVIAEDVAAALVDGDAAAGDRAIATTERVVDAITLDQKRAIEEALVRLAGECDGAVSDDDVGFNGRDAAFGRSLAAQVAASTRNPGRRLSAGQYASALRMLRTYSRTQIAELAPRIWQPARDDADGPDELVAAMTDEQVEAGGRWPPEDDAPFPGDEDAPWSARRGSDDAAA